LEVFIGLKKQAYV